MNGPWPAYHQRRVLILAPTGRDASLTRTVLKQGGIECVICRDCDMLLRELDHGAGAVLLASEAAAPAGRALSAYLARQEPWSDLPVLLLTRQGAEQDREAIGRLAASIGNVFILERPVKIAALTNAVQSLLRARDRQYRARAYLEERNEAVLALQEGDRRKDEFLATLAHELRNPLAPIRNAVHILRLTGGAGEPPIYEMMERQIGHMVRLVDDLLEVSRITRGKIELRRDRTALADIVRTAVETVRPLLETCGHELVIETPGEPLELEADAVRLAQVFANLLHNAAKYTNPGGRIVVHAERQGDWAVVTVQDNGIGIDADSLARVFEMFMQGEAGKARGGGLGVGLTLARTLVEMHHGFIAASSPGPSQGSRFTVRLPLVPEASRPVPSSDRDSGGMVLRSRITRILVVDDNRDGADSLRLLLELIGVDVRVAYDGREAIAIASAFQPELAFVDIGMPGMNGYDVARRLRAGAAGEIVLIALTGWGQPLNDDAAKAAGFDRYLIKPVDMDALQQLLDLPIGNVAGVTAV